MGDWIFVYLDSQNKIYMTREQVKEHIYQHISTEYEMGIPVHESWDGIFEGEEWVDESIKSGFTLEQLRGEIFEEVLEEWEKEHQVRYNS